MTRVTTTHGYFEISEEGVTLTWAPECDCGEERFFAEYNNFNVTEWRRYHGKEELPGEIDIRDLGFNHPVRLPPHIKVGKRKRIANIYQPPDREWREKGRPQ